MKKTIMQINFWIIIFVAAALVVCGSVFICCNEPIRGGMFFLFALIDLAALCFTPWGYTFDRKGLTIGYIFGRSLRFSWDKVTFVVAELTSASNGKQKTVYRIEGEPERKPGWGIKALLEKTEKTTACLLEYAEEKLVDFTKYEGKTAICDVDMPLYMETVESGMKAAALRYIEKLRGGFQEIGLVFSFSFAYIPDVSEEEDTLLTLPEKPEGNAAYAAVFHISQPNETDPKKIFDYTVDLVEYKDGEMIVDSGFTLLELDIFNDILKMVKAEGWEAFMQAEEDVEEIIAEDPLPY